nr:MAG TPA: hypothetical protein [Caudoviricetes sp.]
MLWMQSPIVSSINDSTEIQQASRMNWVDFWSRCQKSKKIALQNEISRHI